MKGDRTLEVNVVDTRTALFGLDITLQLPTVGVFLVVFLPVLDNIRDERLSDNFITSLRLCNVQTVEDRVDLVAFQLVLDAVLQKGIACLVLQLHDTLVGVT